MEKNHGSGPKILAILPGFMPTSLMYIIKPFLGLEAEGQIQTRIELETYFDVRRLGWADLVVFCRNVEPRYSYILDAVLQRGIPYVYDIDDNLFAVPQAITDGEYYRAPERTALLTRYLQNASLVRTYSQLLLQRISTLNANVCQVASVIDWSVVEPPAVPPGGGRVKIVYATSRRDDYLFPIFTVALRQALMAHAGQVEMHFWGFKPTGLESLRNVYYHQFDPNYNAFMRRFSSAGFDIGLAPMLDDDFHRAKTNTKFREYGACGIPGIYSDVALYNECVEDGVTGLLVKNKPEAWGEALEKLITNPDLRRQIGSAAEQQVRQKYSQERFQAVWLEMIHRLLETAPGRPPAQPGPARPALGRALEAKPAAGSTHPGPAGPARAPASIWRSIIKRAVELMRAGEIGRSFFNLRVHINNLWWLYRINRLKRF